MNQHITTIPINVMPTEDDRRVAALADIKRMHDDLTAALASEDKLRASLHREEDRCVMLIEERNKYRREATKLRMLVTELATQMGDIALLTVKAQEVMQTVAELDDDLVSDQPRVVDQAAE